MGESQRWGGLERISLPLGIQKQSFEIGLRRPHRHIEQIDGVDQRWRHRLREKESRLGKAS